LRKANGEGKITGKATGKAIGKSKGKGKSKNKGKNNDQLIIEISEKVIDHEEDDDVEA
jgi:hypothetical protein